MKKYKADLGSWERGITVEFEAEDKRVAITKATEVLHEEIRDENLPVGSMVVQMSENDVCIFDYMNGFYAGNLLAFTRSRA